MTNDKKRLVLVADDDSSMREVVSEHLQSVGYDVLVAEDGEQALSLARRHRPDVVVLDVMMPQTSGWEVCRTIREEPGLASTGVLMLTGIGNVVNSMTSPLYDADAYMDKPFEFAELDAKLTEAINVRARKRGANGVAGMAHPGPKKASPAKAAPKKAAPKKAAPKKAAPKKAKALAKAAPKKTKAAPKKSAPKSALRDTRRGKKAATKKAAPKKAKRKPAAKKRRG